MAIVHPSSKRSSHAKLALQGKQCGAAMLEFAVIIPLFVLLMGGIVDVGRGLEQYFLLRRLAYEAGRLASNTERLEVGDFSSDAANGTGGIQGALHGKIRSMLDFHVGRFPEHVTIETARFAAESPGNASATADSNLVRVSLSTSLTPIFIKIFPAFPISATVEGPYLFVENSSNGEDSQASDQEGADDSGNGLGSASEEDDFVGQPSLG